MEQPDFRFKIVFLGNWGVGKTCLIFRLVDDIFKEDSETTIIDAKIKNTKVGDHSVRLIYTDTAGQERFKTLTSSFYRHSHCMVLMYDMSNRDSFSEIEGYIQEANRFAEKSLKILVAAKSDLAAEREVSEEEAREYSLSIGLDAYFEVSSKDGNGVPQLEQWFTDTLMASTGVSTSPKSAQQVVELALADADRSSKKACTIL